MIADFWWLILWGSFVVPLSMVGARGLCAWEELHRGDRRGRGGGSCFVGVVCVGLSFFLGFLIKRFGVAVCVRIVEG